MRPLRLTSCALTLLFGLAAPDVLPGQQERATLERFLRTDIALAPAELAAALRGDVVVKVLATPNPRDVAVFGIVAVNAPRSRIVQRLAAFPGSLATPTRTRLGLFGEAPSAGDVEQVRVDDEAVGELRKCRPNSCNFKMPAADMSRVQRLLADGATRDVVARYVRQRMVEYVADYRSRGNAALVVYDDRGGVKASEAFTELLAASPYLYRYVPRLHEYLRAYPAGRPSGARDALVWWQDEMPGLRPMLGITHVTLYDTPELPGMSILSAKQLYANHYFEAAFDLLTVVDRAEAPGGAYLVVLRRYRFDNLPSGGLVNIRGRVVGKLRDAMRNDLGRAKQDYGSGGAQ